MSNPDFGPDDTGVPVSFFVGEDGRYCKFWPSIYKSPVSKRGWVINSCSVAVARKRRRCSESQEQPARQLERWHLVRTRRR
jgi:hypothetical protein